MIKQFSIDKVLQATSYIQNKTSVTNYMKIIKLLFFSDRYYLRSRGGPLSFDSYNAMRYGPVPSSTLNILKKDEFFFNNDKKYINSKIHTLSKYDIEIREKNRDYLSKADLVSIDASIEVFSKFDHFQLAEITHDYPEWKKYERYITDTNKSERMYYVDFFNNPNLEESPFIKKYLNGIDPFKIDMNILEDSKEQFILFCK